MKIKKVKYLILFWGILYSFFIYSSDDCEILDNTEFKESPFLYQKVKQLGRLYFYSQPTNDSCKIKNLFIIHDDSVQAYATYNGFTFVEFTSKKGVVTSGWVKSEGIELDRTITHLGDNINKNDFTIKNNQYNLSLDEFSGKLFTSKWINDLNRCVDLGVGVNTSASKFTYDDLVVYTAFQHPIMPKLNVNNIDNCQDLQLYGSNTIIALKILTNQYQTARGITIGSSKDDLFKTYNPKDLKKLASNECLSDIYNSTCYDIHYNQNIIRFILNQDEKVRIIEMSMYPTMLPL